MAPRRLLLLGLVGVAAILLAGRALSTLYIEYLWYRALDATALWRTRVTTVAFLRGISGLLASLFVFANLYVVRHSVISLVLPRRVGNLDIGEEVPGRVLMLGVAALSLLFGALLAIPQSDWTTALLARHGLPFGDADPYFDADLRFYVYWLPFERSLFHWALFAVLLVTAVVVFLYALTPSLRWDRGSLHVSGYVRRHLTVLGALLLLLLAWSYRLDAYEVLTRGGATDSLVTWVDHGIVMPASLILSLLTAAAALFVLWAGWVGQTRLGAGAVLALILLSVILREVAPAVVPRVARAGEGQAQLESYRRIRAQFTWRAYGVERIAAADPALGFGSIPEAGPHVSVWDPSVVVRALESDERPAVPVGEVGWHPSEIGLVALAPQRLEIRAGGSPVPALGVTRILAYAADSRGRLIRRGNGDEVDQVLSSALITDSAPGALLLADSLDAIAAPELVTTASRLAHAWSLQNFRLLFDDLPEPRPTFVRRREVRERVHAIAPFFVQGSAVTPLVADESLLWAVHLYAASSAYPLSAHLEAIGVDRTYFQYAATAIVDAASGRVMLLRTPAAGDARSNPIASSWFAMFPSLFVPAERVPPTILAALPPPVDAGRVQAIVFARFGQRFGDAIARAALPTQDLALEDSLFRADSVPLISLPSLGGTVWTTPILDAAERVAGLFIVPGVGVGRARWLPIPTPGPPWHVVLDRLRLARDTLEVGTRGNLIYGRVRAVPVGGQVAFVQPRYLLPRAEPPRLVGVAVAIGDSAQLGPMLTDLGEMAVDPVAVPDTPEALRARAAALYEAMRSALRAGDWERFGAAFDSLGRLVGAR